MPRTLFAAGRIPARRTAATMTKAAFTEHYRSQLLARYEWARDAEKLERFMSSVTATLNGANSWNHDGEAVTAAWRGIGGKGKPSKIALQSLA